MRNGACSLLTLNSLCRPIINRPACKIGQRKQAKSIIETGFSVAFNKRHPLRGTACLHQKCIEFKRMTLWVFYICAHACICSVEILFLVWCAHANASIFLQWHTCEWEPGIVTDENVSDCQGMMQLLACWRILTHLLLCGFNRVFWVVARTLVRGC